VSGVLKNSLWLVGFVVACALAVAIRLDHVHNATGEWRMRPSAEPSLLRYHGHLYDRTGTAMAKDLGFVRRGKDLGGGTILAPRAQAAPPLIQVEALRRYYEYRIAG
jgi:hypothetical protein